MTTPSLQASALRALHEALGPIAPGVERILRPTDAGPHATERRDGAPPRVFTCVDGAPVELHAHSDRGLRAAHLLADTKALAAALGPTCPGLQRAELVAWRPGRRAVLRLSGEHGTCWLKLLDTKSWRRAARTFAALGETIAPVQLARPLALLPELHGYVAPHAPGIALRDALAAGDVSHTAVVRAVLALAWTRVDGALPTSDFAGARAAAVKSLTQATALRPELGVLATTIAAVPPPAEPTTPGFVHGDLHDKQLFLADGTVTLIDLEGASVGDPRFDLVNLAEHLRLRELQRGAGDSGSAEHLLSRGGLYPDAASTAAWRVVVRARLCGVYALRPRWHELVDRLHEETRILMERLA